MNAELTQNTPEWLEFRRKKIGASDAPIILEVSPWKTPYQLWLEKTSGSLPPSTVRQKRGLELEELARQVFEKKTGMIMFPKVVLHPSLDWMMASLDGIDIDGQAIVEIKCPGQTDHDVAKTGKVPEKYIPQLQHQLAVTGVEIAYYFSFDGNDGVSVSMGMMALSWNWEKMMPILPG
jgi:putative phage-type endonuclease